MIRIRSGLSVRGEIDTNGYPIKNVGAPDDDTDVATKAHVEQYAAPAALLGQPGGIALLDASGAVPVEQLPASLGGAAPAPVTSVAGRLGDVTLTSADLPDFTGGVDARIAAQKGAASGLVPLGADSKVASTYLPAIAITSTFAVASQAAQLALTAQQGDVAVRTDLSQSFIHNGGTSATMADWTLLATPTSTVTSVAGRTGVVTLAKADVGLANVDNTADMAKPVSAAQATAITAALDRANHTGTQVAATISDFAAAADVRITAQKGTASGLAPLGPDSKVASTYLPAIAITSTFTVASQAAQLALAAQEGDVAIRTDLSQTFIHNGGSAGSMADWTLLATPTDTVTSVAGRTGAVILAAADVAGVETPAGAQTKADAAAAASIPLTQKGAASGVATLGVDGKVPTAQLPAGTGGGGGTSAVTSVNTRVGDVVLTAADLGLGNVNNTSDVDKPVSTAQAAADTAAKDRANHTGTQTAATISDFSTAADARITAQKGAASGLAPLGADSKVASNYLPAIAITSTFTVASQAAQLALNAQEGDVAIRTDLSQTFIHNAGTAGTMADWTLLATPTDTVTSVAGRAGVVTLSATDVSGVETPAGAQAKADAAAAASVPLTQKAAAGGVATLGPDGKVPTGQSQVISVAGQTGIVTLSAADVTGVETPAGAQAKADAAAAASIPLTQRAAAGGVATLGSDGKVLSAQLPASTGGTVTAADVGLGNVNNTSDVDKPVSTAQAAADNLRVLKAGDSMTGDLNFGATSKVIFGADNNAALYRNGTGVLRTDGVLHSAAGRQTSNYIVERAFTVAFPAGANNKADIYIPGGFGAALEVTLVGQYGGANAAGVVRASYTAEANAAGVASESSMAYTGVEGNTANYFGLTPLTWDATNSRWKITVVHRTAEANNVFIGVKAVCSTGQNLLRDSMGVSAVYNTDTTTVAAPTARSYPLAVYPKVGQWINGGVNGAYSTSSWNSNRAIAIPLPVARSCTINTVHLNIVNAAVAGTSPMYVGWFASDTPDLMPGTFGEQWGSFASTATGNFTIAANTTFTGPGLYWVVITTSNAATTPTTGTVGSASSPYVNNIGTSATQPTLSSLFAYSMTVLSTITGLPTTYTADSVIGGAPRVSMKVSALV